MIAALLQRPRMALAGALVWTLASAAVGWAANGWRLESELASMKYDHATTVIAAQRAERAGVQQVLEGERRLREGLEGHVRDAKDETRDVASAAGGMSLELDRLRVAFRESAAKHAAAIGAATAACGGGATAVAGVVPSGVVQDMLGEAAEALSVLAQETDHGNIGARLCAAVYAEGRAEQAKLKAALSAAAK